MTLQQFTLVSTAIPPGDVFKAISTAIPSTMIQQAIEQTNTCEQRSRLLRERAALRGGQTRAQGDRGARQTGQRGGGVNP